MILETKLEERLLNEGLHTFDLTDKNNLIAILATRNNLLYSQVDEEYILNYQKELKSTLLSEQCEATILKGFKATNGHFYRTNRDDQVNLIGQKDELDEDSTMTTVLWKTEDAGYIAHTREQWLGIYQEAFAHKKVQLFKYNALRLKILAAKTSEEVSTVKWEEDPDT